jgi:hypothetical protein
MLVKAETTANNDNDITTRLRRIIFSFIVRQMTVGTVRGRQSTSFALTWMDSVKTTQHTDWRNTTGLCQLRSILMISRNVLQSFRFVSFDSSASTH